MFKVSQYLLFAVFSSQLLGFSSAVSAQDTPDYFKANCMSCHTIGGGPLAGPDLKNVETKKGGKDRAWLINFMMDPKGVIASGDQYADRIKRESNNVTMPTLPGLNKARAEKLLDLIAAESKLKKSQFEGIKFSNKPFTVKDVANGKNIFLGLTAMEKGGTSCVSCHSMYDISALGGGRLGPDLTKVYGRLKGRKGLSTWLVAPGTETMLPIFKKHPLNKDEIHALVAYFDSSAKETPSQPGTSRTMFFLFGLVGAAVVIFLFDFLWKWRFHAVRKPLVEKSNR